MVSRSLQYIWNVFLNIPKEADLLDLHQVFKQKIGQNLIDHNKKCRDYDHVNGQRILIKTKGSRKIDSPTIGPLPIT